MAKDNKIQMPSGFGGLMRYGEEYESYINLKPAHVIVFLIILVILRIGLGLFLG